MTRKQALEIAAIVLSNLVHYKKVGLSSRSRGTARDRNEDLNYLADVIQLAESTDLARYLPNIIKITPRLGGK